MKIKKNCLNFAIKKANQSKSKFKISAIGFDVNDNFLGSAFNKSRFNRYGGGYHAEMILLQRYGKNIKKILICRVGNSGEVLPIEPCPRCKKVLDKYKIKVMKMRGDKHE